MAIDQPTGETGQIIAEFIDEAGDYEPSDIEVDPANSPELANVSSVLKHFVASEEGATAVLATAFDPECLGKNDPRRRQICDAFVERCPAPLPKEGPSLVWTERDGGRLLMIWGDWAVIVEVEVRSSSTSSGQLQRCCERVASQLRCGRFSACSKILAVWMTPRNVGRKEFDSFRLPGAEDRKVHLVWEDLLPDLSAIFGDGSVR